MEFMSPDHQDRYTQAVATLPEFRRRGRDWRATLYLLTGNPELWQKAGRYFDGQRGEYNWVDMLEREDFTGGLLTLASLSVALFNGDGGLKVADLWERLDRRNFDLALAAISLRRG